MKTSFEKFMASSAVNQVELGEHKVELALIDEKDQSTWCERYFVLSCVVIVPDV